MSGVLLVDRYADATPAQIAFLTAATAQLMGHQTSAGVADPSGGAGGTSGETLDQRIQRRRAAAETGGS